MSLNFKHFIASLPDEDLLELQQLVASEKLNRDTFGLTADERTKAVDNPIVAIKMHRMRTGFGLKESKEAIDNYRHSIGLVHW